MTEETLAVSEELEKPQEIQENPQESAPVQDTGDAPAEPQKSKVQKRIDELTGEKYALKNQNQHLLTEFQRLQQEVESLKQPKEQREPPQKPSLEQFDGDLERYTVAVTDWTEERVAFERNEFEARIADQQAKEKAQAESQSRLTLEQQWTERRDQAAEKLDNYQLIAGSIDLNDTMTDLLIQNEKGPEILYHLGLNADTAERIRRMEPLAAAQAIGRLEIQIEQANAPDLSKAPPPPNPVGGGSTVVDKDPEDMSFQEYEIWRQNGGGK